MSSRKRKAVPTQATTIKNYFSAPANVTFAAPAVAEENGIDGLANARDDAPRVVLPGSELDDDVEDGRTAAFGFGLGAVVGLLGRIVTEQHGLDAADEAAQLRVLDEAAQVAMGTGDEADPALSDGPGQFG